MPWLPGADRDAWNDRCDTRIEFFERYAAQSSDTPLHAVDALTRAAEIAFASDRSEQAKRLVEGALDILGTDMPLSPHRLAVLGALTGRVRTKLVFVDTIPTISLLDRSLNREVIVFIGGDGPVLEQTLGSLIVSAVASGEAVETLSLLCAPEPSESDPNARKVFAIATSTAEADMLPLFGLERRQDGGFKKSMSVATTHAAVAAVIASEQRYAARLRLSAMDRSHWTTMRARAPLIDWSLLVLCVAIRRRKQTRSIKQLNASMQAMGQVVEVHQFLSGIATQFQPSAQPRRGKRTISRGL